MINDRDLLRATAQRRREERLLYYADFVGESVPKTLEAYGQPDLDTLFRTLGFFCPVRVSPSRRVDAPVYDYAPYYKDIQIPAGVFIQNDGVLELPGSQHHFTRLISPLRNATEMDEILAFPLYKKPEYYDFSTLPEDIAILHDQDKVAIAWVGRLFETSWPLRGYENMLADMLVDVDIATYFLNHELAWNLAYSQHAAQAGADALFFGDDVGSQHGMTFSAQLWRKLIKPRWAEVFQAAKTINPEIVLWYHSCGDVTDIIPDLIEIGLDILNPIQPECMDIYAIQRQFGDKLSFDGGVGTQTVMPFGKPADVVREIERLVSTFGKNGGFILAPSHVIEPEVPIANIQAFVQTAQRCCRG